MRPRRERQQDTRSLLIHVDAFEQLKQFQHRATAPRLDMRYLVEGAIELLAANGAQAQWIAASRKCLEQALGRSGTGDAADGCITEGAASDAARTHGAPVGEAHKHPDCKSLLIGIAAFEQLKAIQGTTRDPRLEMRSLVEGAISLLTNDETKRGNWVHQSRQALQNHLAHLLLKEPEEL